MSVCPCLGMGEGAVYALSTDVETKCEKRDDILQSEKTFTQFPCLNAVEPSLHLGLL